MRRPITACQLSVAVPRLAPVTATRPAPRRRPDAPEQPPPPGCRWPRSGVTLLLLGVGVRGDPAPRRAPSPPGSLSLGRLRSARCASARWRSAAGCPGRPGAQWAAIVAIGVLWFGVYNVALNAGEQHVDAGTAVMLIQVSPVLVALLAATFLHERFTLYLGDRAGAGVRRHRADRDGVRRRGRRPQRARRGAVPARRRSSTPISLVLQKPLVARLPAIHVTWLACSVGAVVCLPFAGQLVGEAARRVGLRHLVGGLPRGLPDRDRVHDVRLRAAHHDGEQPRRHDLPRPADHDRDGLAAARRDPARRWPTSGARSR